jgi:hypothetical protein
VGFDAEWQAQPFAPVARRKRPGSKLLGGARTLVVTSLSRNVNRPVMTGSHSVGK